MSEILDFSVYSDVDRTTYIKNKISDLGRNPTTKELDLWSNYILYGKDSTTGRSVVDDGLVEIPTKYGSYKKKKDKNLSLNELLESPTFSESEVQPLAKPIYTTPKPKLNPSLEVLEPLRDEIERLEDRLKRAEAELAADPSTASLTATQVYHLRHEIISLKSQQYIVQDSVAPITMLRSTPHYADHADNFELTVWPLGLKLDNGALWTDPRNADETHWDTYNDPDITGPVLDFTNPSHIYAIVENWQLLQAAASKNGTSDEWYILETFRYYAERADLNPVRRAILQLKTAEVKNAAIREYINSHFNTHYNENYISTIYCGNICPLIAAEAQLHYQEWLQRGREAAWKKCPTCGRWKLRNSDQFGRKRGATDGLSSSCRRCNREKARRAK